MTAASGLPRLAAVRHAACVHSRVDRARPNIDTCQCWACAASVECAKREKRAKSPKSRVGGRRTRPYRAEPHDPSRGPRSLPCAKGTARCLTSESCAVTARTRMGKCAVGAGRPGGVGRGDFLRWVFLSLAERTWCGRARAKLSDPNPSLFRQVLSLRRRGSAQSAHLSACIAALHPTMPRAFIL